MDLAVSRGKIIFLIHVYVYAKLGAQNEVRMKTPEGRSLRRYGSVKSDDTVFTLYNIFSGNKKFVSILF